MPSQVRNTQLYRYYIKLLCSMDTSLSLSLSASLFTLIMRRMRVHCSVRNEIAASFLRKPDTYLPSYTMSQHSSLIFILIRTSHAYVIQPFLFHSEIPIRTCYALVFSPKPNTSPSYPLLFINYSNSPPPFFLRGSIQWARASSFTRILDHTQRRTTVGRTPLDE
jgi:hypothetical protein